jgi:hypothetical protein
MAVASLDDGTCLRVRGHFSGSFNDAGMGIGARKSRVKSTLKKKVASASDCTCLIVPASFAVVEGKLKC